jgi:hypothetical protein
MESPDLPIDGSVMTVGELILAASDEARQLNIVLLDEPSEKMLRMNKSMRKEKEVSERSIKDEVVIHVPPGKRVRIVMTSESKPSRKG